MSRHYRRNVFRSLFFILYLVSFGLHAGGVSDEQIKRLIVFGDSLSDPGNAFILTGMQSLAPYSLIPDAPYAIGGHHFSNGHTWVEQFAKKQDTTAKPAFRYDGGTNYAVGGSRARNMGQVNLTTQVGLYLSQYGSALYKDNVFVIFIGGNDIRDAIDAFAADPTGQTSAAIISEALTGLQDNLTLLINTGARHFLIANAPDLAVVPAVRLQGVPAQEVANFFSVRFNQGLEQILGEVQTYYPVTVNYLDIFTLLHHVAANPEHYGIDEAELPCITPDVIVGAICKHQNDYLFWDGIHPTREGHKIISHQALYLLEDDRKAQSGIRASRWESKHARSERGDHKK